MKHSTPNSWKMVQEGINRWEQERGGTLSLRELGRQSTVNTSQLSLWSNGKEMPSDKNVMKIAITLNLDYEKLQLIVTQEKNAWKQQQLWQELDLFARITGDKPAAVALQRAIGTKAVPVYGKVPAGEPNTPEAQDVQYTSIASSLVKGDTVFGLKAIGNSMIGRGINDGDTIILDTAQQPDSGDIAVLMIGNEATVKEIHKIDNSLILQSANPEIPPIVDKVPSEEVHVVGKVIAVVKTF